MSAEALRTGASKKEALFTPREEGEKSTECVFFGVFFFAAALSKCFDLNL